VKVHQFVGDIFGLIMVQKYEFHAQKSNFCAYKMKLVARKIAAKW
jgi:hypothetical protein